jgi:hypothetical protein
VARSGCSRPFVARIESLGTAIRARAAGRGRRSRGARENTATSGQGCAQGVAPLADRALDVVSGGAMLNGQIPDDPRCEE